MELKELLMFMTKKGASDLHLKPMRPPLLRIQGRLIPIKANPLKPDEVEQMLGKLEEEEGEEPKLRIDFKVGDTVKIKEGPFENFDGVVEEVIPSKGLVRVVVTIFGRSTRVELEYWKLESV